MPDFRTATEQELKALRALKALQKQARRVELRLATNRARVRVARALKSVRSMRTVTDLRWHAQITKREAEALRFLAGGVKARQLFTKLRDSIVRKLK